MAYTASEVSAIRASGGNSLRCAADERIIERVRMNSRTGRPLGSESFVAKIEAALKTITQCAKKRKEQYKRKLTSGIKEVTGSGKIYNRQRVEEEAAIFARTADISEETCRVEAHIKAFRKALFNHKEIGRRLDFIAQEISREANTIGAKANNFKIAGEVIKIKSNIEKIREQAQNVE